MALSVDNNKTYRLRDLRDNAVPRDRSEPRAPSRRPKFQDSLSHPKAGEIVGEFPSRYNKGKDKQQGRGNTLQVAAKRQQPRQAVAALMAKEGISTATKFGARSNQAGSDDKVEEKREEARVAWKGLLDDNDIKKPEKSAADRGIEERLKRLRDQEKELNALKKFSAEIDGTPVQDYMKKQDQRVLKEAGRLERSSEFAGLSRGSATNLELMKKEMAMNQQLNMQYLQMQEKLQRGLTSLLSNLLKTRSETVKNAISGAG